jgi:hypothetical protein
MAQQIVFIWSIFIGQVKTSDQLKYSIQKQRETHLLCHLFIYLRFDTTIVMIGKNSMNICAGNRDASDFFIQNESS